MSHHLSFLIQRPFQATQTGITIPFELERGNRVVGGNAKVDTGSEFCLFQRELAEELGIEVEAGQLIPLSTLTGIFTAYAHTLILNTFGVAFESLVLFSPAYNTNRNILGRVGWLNNLHLALTMNDEMIYLTPAYSEETL